MQKLLILAAIALVQAELLEVIQIETPPRTNFKNPSCRQVVFEHEFGSSYGAPYIGTYTPPTCNFTTTIFNLSVTSRGRQYDRLALLFFGDIEIWRTSTAMPTETGIFWNYQKDMTIFDVLLRKKQKVIFDLSNVFNEVYTGAYNVTLEALYFNDFYEEGLNPANLILPISNSSAAQKNLSSVMDLPDGNGTVLLSLPKNTEKAVVSILASGNGNEEFWYTNVPSEYISTFPDNEGWLYGYSPFREIELLIDGQLAGVSWPFPILFSGGVDPGLWRPVVGIDTYDLPSFEIDVTPWLGLLCDGGEHAFKLRVVGWDDGVEGGVGAVGENWWVTGRVFVWVDEGGVQTTGSDIQSYLPPPTFQFHPEVTTITSSNSTTNTSLYFELSAQRTLTISSIINTSTGPKNATWTQSLDFLNIQNVTADGYNQSLHQVTTSNYSGSYSNTQSSFAYPINLYSAYIIAPSLATLSSVFALIDRSLLSSGINTLPFLTGTSIGKENVATRQNASSMYFWNETIVEGTAADTGVTEQWFSFSGMPGNKQSGVSAFSRFLKEVDDAIVEDEMAWVEKHVPETEPLPIVDGEPIV